MSFKEINTNNIQSTNRQVNENNQPKVSSSSTASGIFNANNKTDFIIDNSKNNPQSISEILKTTEEENDFFITETEVPVEEKSSKENNKNVFAQNVEYETKGYYYCDGMHYLVIGPKDVGEDEELPVLVYLHGTGERGGNKGDLENSSLPKTLLNGEETSEFDENFRGYIICPQLPSKSGDWCNNGAAEKIVKIINDFDSKENVNIDRDNMAIAGHSLGGNGAIYMAENVKDENGKPLFKRVAVLSATEGDISNIEIPANAYVGTEDNSNSDAFMHEAFNNPKEVPSDHGHVPQEVLKLDENQNGRPDFFEDLYS